MNFVKGTLIGVIAGTIIGAMNSDGISHMMNKGRRQIRSMKRMYKF